MRPAGEGGCLFLFLRTKLHHGEGDDRRLTLDAVDIVDNSALVNTEYLVGTAYRRQLASAQPNGVVGASRTAATSRTGHG